MIGIQVGCNGIDVFSGLRGPRGSRVVEIGASAVGGMVANETLFRISLSETITLRPTPVVGEAGDPPSAPVVISIMRRVRPAAAVQIGTVTLNADGSVTGVLPAQIVGPCTLYAVAPSNTFGVADVSFTIVGER